MFTGIVEEVGTITNIKQAQNMVEIEIEGDVVTKDTALGDSLSTNGVCLTVSKIAGKKIYASAMPETISHTIFSRVKVGDKVNLERAMQPTGRLGGHILTGHIDGIERLIIVSGYGLEKNYTFSLSSEYAKLVAKKGSVGINGVSLTVTDVTDSTFSVSLISHTVENTTLRDMKIADEVNIEVDIIARYIARLFGKDNNQGLTLERMVELGF